jgi:chromosome segregation ATPase
VDARSQLEDARAHNQALERASRKVSVDETERADLHALLKSSTLEAEALALKLADRDAQISDMNAQLKRLRQEREAVTRNADDVTRELDSQLGEMKAQLRRLREEIGTAMKRADAASKELDALQARWAPRQKFRAGVFAVMAAIKMRNQEQQWRGVKALGEELRRQKNRDKGAMLGKWVNAALIN